MDRVGARRRHGLAQQPTTHALAAHHAARPMQATLHTSCRQKHLALNALGAPVSRQLVLKEKKDT